MILGIWSWIRDWNWVLGIGIEDWDCGLGLRLGIGIRDWDWVLRIGDWNGDWDWGLGLGIGIEDWD